MADKFVENLRRMNESQNRTDTENLLLKEMIEMDREDMLQNDIALDSIIPDDEAESIFDDTEPEDDFDETADANSILAGFTMKEIF